MGNKRRPEIAERNRAIATALEAGRKPGELAAEHGISYSQVFRAAREGRQSPVISDQSSVASQQPLDGAVVRQAHHEVEAFQRSLRTGGPLFSELAQTGLRRSGGFVDDEYDRKFKFLNRRVQLYREMGNDPIVQAVLQAIRMTVRRVGWFVEPGGETPEDEAAAEFIEQAMEDMSLGWADIIDQALGMIQYGFQAAEIVYKRRVSTEGGRSKYDDGRIGWRKWVFVAPESLVPGDEWVFDEKGGLQGFKQQLLDGNTVTVPIDKAILFRTTVEKGNPEGRSILRAMYPAWYFKKQLEEVEGISAERMGAGFPVIYAGADVGKDDTGNSDFAKLKDIVRNVRVDDQMGLVLPWAKMGHGAREGEGVLFELVSPPSRGVVNFHETIVRFEQRIAMVGLAQFVHLGMSKIGTQALAESLSDFFTLSVSAWADGIAETINRFAVERLIRLNNFGGLTAAPRIAHEAVSGQSLTEVAGYINQLVGAGLITPEPELEDHLRTLADLPVRAEQSLNSLGLPTRAGKSQTPNLKSQIPNPKTLGVEGQTVETGSETFADVRGTGRPGRRAKQIEAVNAYQRELEAEYEEWADELAQDLAGASTDGGERDRVIEAALAALLLALLMLGRRRLPEAMEMGLGDTPPTVEALRDLAAAVEANERYLRESLLPDIERKLRAGLEDPDVRLALGAGRGEEAIGGLLRTMEARAALYAGAWWGMYNRAVGAGAGEGPVRWLLDPTVKSHCQTCLEFGDREYPSYAAMLQVTGGIVPSAGTQCDGNCRCVLVGE